MRSKDTNHYRNWPDMHYVYGCLLVICCYMKPYVHKVVVTYLAVSIFLAFLQMICLRLWLACVHKGSVCAS